MVFDAVGGGGVIEVRSKPASRVKKGDIVGVLLGGGGGYGSPALRDPRDIERDLADGLLRPETARRLYRRQEAAE